jgi:hypothetical protein
MSFKNSLVMAVLLALVSVFIFRVEIPDSERRERDSFVLNKVDDKEISSIRVSLEGANTFDLKRKEKTAEGESSAWFIEGLPDAPLDSSKVTALLRALQEFKSDAAIPSNEVSQDKGVYGLGDKSTTVTVRTGEQDAVIRFGKLNDFIGKRYIEVSKNGISQLVMGDELLHAAAHVARDDYREKNPVQFSDFAVKRVVIEYPKDSLRIVLSQEAGDWKVVEPVDAPADATAINEFFRNLRGFKAERFIDGISDQSKYSLDKPDARFEILFSDETRRPIRATIAQEDRSLRDSDASSEEKTALYLSVEGGTVFESRSAMLAQLKTTVFNLRKKKLFDFDVDQVQKVIFSGAGLSEDQKMSLESVNGGWKVNSAEADPVFVRQVLSDLSALEAIDFPRPGVDPKTMGLGQPFVQVQIILKANDGKVTERALQVGAALTTAKNEQGRYMLDSNQPAVPWIISQESLLKRIPKQEQLKKLEATPAPLVTPLVQK